MGVDFRYKKLGYIVLNVTDIEKSTKFATDVFGLDASGESADGARFFRSGTAHHDIILAPARPADSCGMLRGHGQLGSGSRVVVKKSWMPAYAGMTNRG